MKARSGFERRVMEDLTKRKVSFEYEGTKLQYFLECWYLPDIKLANGIYVEVKGRFTAADRRKMLAVKEAHPTLDIRFLFQADNPIRKGSRTRYSDWARRHGFSFCVGATVPTTWTTRSNRGGK